MKLIIAQYGTWRFSLSEFYLPLLLAGICIYLVMTRSMAIALERSTFISANIDLCS